MTGYEKLCGILEEICLLKLSKIYIEKGHHDNSGTIVKQHDNASRMMFSLDLSGGAIAAAIENGCDTLITHHPAIYYPISSIEGALAAAVRAGLNVLSMHLNLDVAKGGIDDCLAEGLGAKKIKIIDPVSVDFGYGREFQILPEQFEKFIERVKREFRTERVVAYGGGLVRKVASFCGGGSGDAENYRGDADLIVTSDMPHHVIKSLTERGKKILLLTHYAAEEYGFKKFYENVKRSAADFAECFIYEDSRFMIKEIYND